MDAEPSQDSGNHEYLSDQSPQDKPWDINKLLAQKLSHLYKGTVYHKIAERMGSCATQLEFGWVDDPSTDDKARLRLKSAQFCRCRHCTICQWRRSLMWTARFLKAFPAILRDYPNTRFIFLTLTIRNCDIEELRSKLDWMNQSWKRMSHRKQFPAIGFARSTEVTRGKDDSTHPHFHVLLMVDPGYFAGKNYLSQQDWTELWRSCLQIEYTPIVHVKAVKPNRRWLANNQDVSAERKLASAVVETFKYSVKPEDLIGQETERDRQWLLQLTSQLDKTRAVALGGVFRSYLSESEPEDLVGKADETENVSASSVFYNWVEIVKRYLKYWED